MYVFKLYILCASVCATAAVSADTRTRPVFIAQRHMSKLNYHPDNPRASKYINTYIYNAVYDCWVSTVQHGTYTYILNI